MVYYIQMRDLKQELADIKVQRADLWKKINEKDIEIELLNKKSNTWRSRFFNLKKKIEELSYIKPSILD